MAVTMAAPIATMDGNLSDSDDDHDDGFGYDYDPQITLDSIEKSKTINFSISANYTSNWKPREAFRELVQNWRDGIVKSFSLAEHDFRVERDERTLGRNTEIVYRVPNVRATGPEPRWLGYIRYKGRDGEGSIDMVNCSATLQPKHLDMGGTSKAGDAAQAGAHGEGLKIALLVLMRGRQNHFVRCCSGGFNWIFNFTTSGRLVARLRRMTDRAIERARDQAIRQTQRPGALLPLVAVPYYDVQFVVGEARRGRNERGDKVTRSLVKQAHFEEWTTAALFLHSAGPDAILTTRAAGDLLLAPQLQGKMHLKGLLLQESTVGQSASMTGRPLRYGYNFGSGRTNRERSSVATASEEGRAILAIWDAVRDEWPNEWLGLVARLSEMLNTAELQYADVAGAKSMSRPMAESLKAHLLGGQLHNNWYYCNEDKSKNPRFGHIIRGLGREGVELTKTYWDVLRQHDLVRTAEEEERLRFMAAPVVAISETGFATSLCRLLRACFSACSHMDGLDFVFVQAGQLNLQLSFSDDDELRFRIHDRWLSVDGASAELGFSELVQSEAHILYHAVTSLFSDALEQLPLEAFVSEDDEQHGRTPDRRRRLEINLAERRLLNYQRIENPSIEPVPGRPALRVRLPVDLDRDANVEIEIQCHRASTCSHLLGKQIARDARSDNIPCMVPEDMDGQGPGAAGSGSACRATRYNSWTGEHEEGDLVVGEEYFFLCVMTPADLGAFISLSGTYRGPDVAPLLDEPMSPVPVSLPAVDSGGDNLGDDGIYNSIYNDFDDRDEQTGTRPVKSRNGLVKKRPIQPALDPWGASWPTSPVVNGDGSSSAAACVSPAALNKSPADVAAGSLTGLRFEIGPELRLLNIIDVDHWHSVKRDGVVSKYEVVGIMKGMPLERDRPRKRQRTVAREDEQAGEERQQKRGGDEGDGDGEF